MTLQIIGAGFGRTGTNSLKTALEILGYKPCYHLFELKENPDHVAFWNKANSGNNVNWESFFKSYNATVDWPAAAFVTELNSTFRNSKVILTIRDPEEWYESAKNTIFKGMANWKRIENPETKERMKMANSIILNGIFSGKYENKSHCINVFKKHIENMRKTIKPEKLLEFNVSEGWEPLSKFLEQKVPNTPFPHTNTRESFHKYKPK